MDQEVSNLSHQDGTSRLRDVRIMKPTSQPSLFYWIYLHLHVCKLNGWVAVFIFIKIYLEVIRLYTRLSGCTAAVTDANLRLDPPV